MFALVLFTDEYGYWILGGGGCCVCLILGGFVALILASVIMANRRLPQADADHRPRRARHDEEEGDVR